MLDIKDEGKSSTNMTKYEEEFFKHLKKKLFFTNIKIKTKISISELCNERNDISFIFNINDIKDIIVDFVLYKSNKAIAGIELIDEPEEFNMQIGKKMLIDTLFRTMGYEYFRIVDLTKLEVAAKIIVDKVTNTNKS